MERHENEADKASKKKKKKKKSKNGEKSKDRNRKKGGKGKSGKAKGGSDSRYKKIHHKRFLREAHNISCCLEVDFNGNTTIVLGEEDIEAIN